MAKQQRLREVPSIHFDDLTLLVRPGHRDFEQPPETIQREMRAQAVTGWRLRRSRATVKTAEAVQDEQLKPPLRTAFRSGPIAGVVRKSPHGGRVWVTQGMSTVPDKPIQLLNWLGKDAERAVTGIEIDPILVTLPKVANKFLRAVSSAVGAKVDFPIKLKVDQRVLDEIAAERDDDVDPSTFFVETTRGEPRVFTRPE